MKILLAEDDLDDQDIFKQVIDSSTHNVELIVADNGETLVEMMTMLSEGELPNLIVADQNMPRLKGSEAIIKLRENPRMKSIPMVIYTTYQDAGFIARCKEQGIELHLKPDTYTGLEKLIDKLIVTHNSDHNISTSLHSKEDRPS